MDDVHAYWRVEAWKSGPVMQTVKLFWLNQNEVLVRNFYLNFLLVGYVTNWPGLDVWVQSMALSFWLFGLNSRAKKLKHVTRHLRLYVLRVYFWRLNYCTSKQSIPRQWLMKTLEEFGTYGRLPSALLRIAFACPIFAHMSSNFTRELWKNWQIPSLVDVSFL